LGRVAGFPDALSRCSPALESDLLDLRSL
jgi:hypothetical protein